MEDPYTILNVNSDASEKEIRVAYYALAMILHPDRHQPRRAEELRAAEEQFCKVDRAFHVLCDPVKRRAYDEFGWPGVKLLQIDESTGGALAEHLKQPWQVRELVAELLREQRRQRLEAKAPVSGTITLECTRLPLWDDSGVMHPLRLLLPKVRQMAVQQQLEVRLSPQTCLLIEGYSGSSSGVGGSGGGGGGGGGATLLASHRPSQRWWVNGGCALGPQPRLLLSSGRSVTRHTALAAHGALQPGGGLSLRVGSSHALSRLSMVQFSYTFGQNVDGFALNVTRTAPTGREKAQVELRAVGSGLSARASFQHNFVTGMRGEANFKLGTRGGEAYVGSDRALSRRARLRIGLRVNRGGVYVVFKLAHGSMRVVVPVRLGLTLDPWAILAASAVPAAADAVVKAVLLRLRLPGAARKRRELQQRARKRRAKARADAAAQTRLMLPTSRARAEVEWERSGLVIHSARYGRDLHVDCGAGWYLETPSAAAAAAAPAETEGPQAHSTDTEPAEEVAPRNIDVTVALQFFVKDSQLRLPPRSKAGLLGFYALGADNELEHLLDGALDVGPTSAEEEDLADGIFAIQNVFGENLASSNFPVQTAPQLVVRYEFARRLYEVTVHDLDEVVLPAANALCMGHSSVVQ